MAETTIVPFGKYKGQPVEVLSEDRAYADWLLAQGWLKQRFPDLHTLIINNFGEPTETPEHNRLQLRFLDETFCARVSAVLLAVFPAEQATPFYLPPRPVFEAQGIDVSWRLLGWECTPHQRQEVCPTALYAPYSEALQHAGLPFGSDRLAGIPPDPPSVRYDGYYGQVGWRGSNPESGALKAAYEAQKTFDREMESQRYHWHSSHPEVNMYDYYAPQRAALQRALDEAKKVHEHAFRAAMAAVKAAWAPVLPYLINRVSATTLCPTLWHEASGLEFAVECKPTLGDDYPAVLRQIRNWPTPHRYRKALVIDAFHAQGGLLDQVRVFFQRSGIVLLTVEEIERTPPLPLATFDDLTHMVWTALDEDARHMGSLL
jgi:hypothetical protein